MDGECGGRRGNVETDDANVAHIGVGPAVGVWFSLWPVYNSSFSSCRYTLFTQCSSGLAEKSYSLDDRIHCQLGDILRQSGSQFPNL